MTLDVDTEVQDMSDFKKTKYQSFPIPAAKDGKIGGVEKFDWGAA